MEDGGLFAGGALIIKPTDSRAGGGGVSGVALTSEEFALSPPAPRAETT